SPPLISPARIMRLMRAYSCSAMLRCSICDIGHFTFLPVCRIDKKFSRWFPGPVCAQFSFGLCNQAKRNIVTTAFIRGIQPGFKNVQRLEFTRDLAPQTQNVRVIMGAGHFAHVGAGAYRCPNTPEPIGDDAHADPCRADKNAAFGTPA